MAEADGEESRESHETKLKVIIIGGGIAGLSAANHLIKNNVTDFILIESRKRIGGRIFALEMDGFKFEMGANWIHGVLGNPMYEIAVANGLVDLLHMPRPHKIIAVTEEGKQIPFQILHETYEAYMCFLHRCEEYFLCQYEPPEGVDSVGEHLELEIGLYLDKLGDGKTMRRRLFDCLLKRETCITGCHSMNEVDLVELGSYAELQGGNILLPSGYASILEPVSRDIPKDKIFLNKSVSKIYWDCGCPDPDASDSDSDQTVIDSEVPDAKPYRPFRSETNTTHHSVSVTCSDGTSYQADHIICTLPLGVLKETADHMFVPQLPENKRESIEKLLFGTVDKIFLAYERPFLHPDISEIMLVWDDYDTSGDMSERWYKKIYSFSKVSETVLVGWVSGEEAHYMETLSDKQVSETCTKILRKFLNDPYVPNPKLCVCTHWGREENTRGAYTAIAVGANQCDIETLATPLRCTKTNAANVLFAGEHTHCSFYSTVHGAYLSGRTAAQSVTELPKEGNLFVDHPRDTSDLSSWIRGISLDEPA